MTMFQKVLDAIGNTTTPMVGSTGYLDHSPWTMPVKGVDPHGRPFFSIPLCTKSTSCYDMKNGEVHVHEGKGMVTFFQRYTSDPMLWVTANSHDVGENVTPILNGAIKDPDNGDVVEMMLRILKGEEVEFIFEKDMYNSRFTMTSRLLTPFEVIRLIQDEIHN